MHHVSEQGALQVRLITAVRGVAAIVDIVPGVLLEPVVMYFFRCEDVIKHHLACQIGMLNTAGE